jgi:beta-lactamase class A
MIRESTFASSSPYRFIDPLLACGISNKKMLTEFMPLKNKINNLIAEKIKDKKASVISVYFDTRDGNWLSINPTEKYSPASLLKVPTAIAFFKEAEENPKLLSKKIAYSGAYDYNQFEYFKPPEKLVPGQSYTIEDLIGRMLGHSDNNAYFLLVENIDIKILTEVYSDLGIVIPASLDSGQADFITIKQYANFFRVLHNASYLGRDMSEKALSLLSKDNLPQGIASGIPKDIPIAEKFGERNFSSQAMDPYSEKELHDCGIIYYPGHPYLLCVMTKGTSYINLAGVISDTSKLVYDYINGEAISRK